MQRRPTYLDTFEHAFDPKGRITVPAEWRREGYETTLVVIPSEKQCLRVYPESWMTEIMEQLGEMKEDDPRQEALKQLAANAHLTTCDQQGRITIRERRRAEASLKKDAVLAGQGKYFEIWDEDVWQSKQSPSGTAESSLRVMGL